MKENVYEDCGPGRGFHIIDAVDILLAEQLPEDYHVERDTLRLM
jgi:hypothetical protein